MGPPASCVLSDHMALIVKPKSHQGTKSQTRKPVVTWDKRYNSVSSFGHFLMDVPWESVLDSDALSMFLSTHVSLSTLSKSTTQTGPGLTLIWSAGFMRDKRHLLLVIHLGSREGVKMCFVFPYYSRAGKNWQHWCGTTPTGRGHLFSRMIRMISSGLATTQNSTPWQK